MAFCVEEGGGENSCLEQFILVGRLRKGGGFAFGEGPPPPCKFLVEKFTGGGW